LSENLDEFLDLTVGQYVEEAARTDQKKGRDAMSFVLLGLVGETGTLLSEAKKKQRDRASYLGYARGVVEELGDVLWYLSAITRRSGLDLPEIAVAAAKRGKLVHGDVTFHELQPAHIPQSKAPTAAFQKTLLELAAIVGSLVEQVQNGVAGAALQPYVVTIFEKLLGAANESGVTLEAAAIKNLHKIFGRWPRERIYPTPADDGREHEEQLPRKMTIDVYERKVRGQVFVYQRSNGVYVGDRLTDNSAAPDDYRFHDVFHYAYVAVLGWSPVIRGLFRLKRKSDPKLDEVQDGARANLLEEGLTSWIFGQAQQLDYFKDVEVGGLPLDMLKQVDEFVAGYEADQFPLWMWEEAIIEGYAAFRFLRKHRRGRVTIDMQRRKLHVEKLP
jgi:NTP pyrophosphatase (non-canonical NTP hydrolase)